MLTETATATATKERPILFSTPMVQAILQGNKTQTRRIIKGIALKWLDDFTPQYVSLSENDLCPYGTPGDLPLALGDRIQSRFHHRKTRQPMKPHAYISGKITGIEATAPALFAAAEQTLLAQGYTPINPMTLPHAHGKSWHEFMREDIKALCDCHAIYMLPNWKESRGAIIEHMLATLIGIEIIYSK